MGDAEFAPQWRHLSERNLFSGVFDRERASRPQTAPDKITYLELQSEVIGFLRQFQSLTLFTVIVMHGRGVGRGGSTCLVTWRRGACVRKEPLIDLATCPLAHACAETPRLVRTILLRIHGTGSSGGLQMALAGSICVTR